ncbi:MAG: phosphotransferase [Pseudomonadota bacterium]
MSEVMTPDAREGALKQWLLSNGLQVETFLPASEDASFRRYFRVKLGAACQWDGQTFRASTSLIAMDAPPAQEDTHTFVRIARAWHDAGVAVPQVFACDLGAGFALLEDLGNVSLLSELDDIPGLADARYAAAGTMLHQLQAVIDSETLNLPAYDDAFLRHEMMLFRDWLCQQHLQMTWSDDDQQQWQSVCQLLAANATSQPQVCVHRDYHSRNLMVRDDGALAMIDFQDAMRGPVCYDIVSLLRDCYISWPIDSVRDWARRWFDDCPHVATAADAQRLRWFFLTGVQRQLKAAGIFARLALRDGKTGYLKDIPRTLSYITAIDGDYPELRWLADLIRERCLPGLVR